MHSGERSDEDALKTLLAMFTAQVSLHSPESNTNNMDNEALQALENEFWQARAEEEAEELANLEDQP